MKILFLGTRGLPAAYGGFESCVSEVAPRLAEKGHEVWVYCRGHDRKKNQYKGTRLFHVTPFTNGNKFIDDPVHNVFTTFHSIFQNADILHFFGTDMLLFALLPRVVRQKVVFTVDGLEWKRTNYPSPVRTVLRSYAGLTMVSANATIVDNLPALRWYRSHFPGRYEYLPYGALSPSTSAQETLALDKFGVTGDYAIFVGRLVPERGAHLAVDALRELNSNLGLVIVGDATKDTIGYVNSLKQSASPNTIFTGFLYGSMMEQLLHHSSIYVHPSIVEGTSISLLTAMGFGKCIVASDLPENRLVLGNAGEYFEPNNPRSLALKLKELHGNPILARRKGEMAKARARNTFEWSAVVNRMVQIYESL